MKSIKTKFITFTLAVILLFTILIGGTAVKNMSSLSNNDSVDIINLMVRKNAADINGILGRIEQSVNILEGCINEYISSCESHPANAEFMDKISAYIDPLLLNAAKSTDGCIGVYIRYSTDIAEPDAGLFYTKNAESSSFSAFPCTDISIYAEDDLEHVGWYYIPRDEGKPTWMMPYYNGNTDEYMISYIIPLYIDNIFIGIMGMDIDFTVLEDTVNNITAYETGQAYLTDKEFNIIYHPDIPAGTSPAQENIEFSDIYNEYTTNDYEGNLFHYEYNGIHKVYTYRALRNGQNLCIAVPEKEISRNLDKTVAYILVFTVVSAVIFIIITIVICGTITKPLQKLTTAARKISEGNLSIEIDVHTSDEIGVLADTLRKTTKELNLYVQKMNKLAYLDSLTGVENKTAYDIAVAKLEEKIKNGSAEFAVAVLDLNELKKTNDTFGHYYGDMLITNAAKLIENSFLDCPVYRIGGDEFVVILEGHSYTARKALYSKLETAMLEERERSEGKGISIAFGASDYASDDKSFSDVFARADNAMYENKKLIKKA